MAFVNEYISTGDFKKYHFNELNKRPKRANGTAPSDVWTIDRESNIWLRQFYAEIDPKDPKGDLTGITVWDFFWQKDLMQVKLLSLEAGRDEKKKHCWERKKLLEIEMSVSMAQFQLQALRDLKSALIAYKDAGIRSEAKTYSLVLE